MADPCIPDAWHKWIQLLDSYLDKLLNAVSLVRGDKDTAYPGFIDWGMSKDWWATDFVVLAHARGGTHQMSSWLLKAIKAAKGLYEKYGKYVSLDKIDCKIGAK
ncbi:hypothetical protein J3R30DRAFT_3411787 [Lentinula aciculospora]|uniref:Uncharacterized protein n=1 Tax=Lentinula aciculospora TaxID=153920 RepID=A0A9W9DFX6_9AGAR|nr:hypothetical protein J3R30DRAFT_3411787 [Lentinula aciculospora]